MSAVPTFREVYLRAKREKSEIVAVVMMADDSIRKVKFGPRGGWWFTQ
mgnify:FL=1|jgi:hypothetical protein